MDCYDFRSFVYGTWMHSTEKIYHYLLSAVKPVITGPSETIYFLQIIK